MKGVEIFRRTFLQGAAGAGLNLCLPLEATSNVPGFRCDWMQGQWGLMVHWIPPGPYPKYGNRIEDFELAVAAFRSGDFARQVAMTNAKWLIFTIGQNTGYYSSPNEYLDSLTAHRNTSRRDLALDLIKELVPRGVRFIAYLPAEIKAVTSLHGVFKWDPNNQREFELSYTQFIEAYSRRFGEGCSGWWLDGCYDWTAFPNSERRWDLWEDACRAGNPRSAIALNNGGFFAEKPWRVSTAQDFLSGECAFLGSNGPVLGRKRTGDTYAITADAFDTFGCLPHILVPIDSGGRWGLNKPGSIEPPLYDEFQLKRTIETCRRCNWAITLNVAIYQEGLIGDETLRLLKKL